MKKYEIREQMLLHELAVKKTLTTREATDLLDISEASTRRLFADLAEKGKLIRVYGGVQLSPGLVAKDEYFFNIIKEEHSIQKQAIAVEACEKILNDDVIYLDCGTTTLQLAVLLAEKLQKQEIMSLRVVTNSLANLEVLHKYCNTVLVGGIYNSNRKDFAGYSAEQFIAQYNYRKAFLGADGYVCGQGFMASDESIARLNQVVISQSDEVYVLLDSSKIGRLSYVKYAEDSDIDELITDADIKEEQIRDLDKGNMKRTIAFKEDTQHNI